MPVAIEKRKEELKSEKSSSEMSERREEACLKMLKVDFWRCVPVIFDYFCSASPAMIHFYHWLCGEKKKVRIVAHNRTTAQFSAKKTSSTSIDVSWSPISGVTKYILQMKQITHRFHDDDSSFKTAFEGQETNYSFRELKKAAK